jgi:hypothetical protein
VRSISKRAPAVYAAGIVLVLFVVALHWIHRGYVIAQSDLTPPFRPWNAFEECVRPWNYTQSYLGQPSWCFTYAPVLFLQALLSSAIGASAAQVLVLFLPYAFAVSGALYCARVLGLSVIAASVVAVVYVLNPYMQVITALNVSVPIFSGIFAWTCALFVLAARQPRRRRACLIALAGIFAFVLETVVIMPHLLVEVLFGLAVWLGISIWLSDDRRAYARWLLACGPVLFAASLWWLVPSVIALASSQNVHPLQVTQNAWTFATSSLLNLMRLNPLWQWAYADYFPAAPAYDANPLLYAAGFALLFGLVAALGVLRGRTLRIAAALGLAALAFLFVAKGTHGPLAGVTSFIMTLPLVFVFQDPAGLIVMATFFLAVIAGLLIGELQRTRPRSAAIASGGFVLAAVASAWLLVSGVVFHARATTPSMYVRVPWYWTRLDAALAGPPDEGVLVLPPDATYDATYAWGYRGADMVPIQATRRRVLLPGPPFQYFITAQRTSIYSKVVRTIASRPAAAAGMLRDLGIRYVIERHDVMAPPQGFPASHVRAFGGLTIADLGASRPLLTDLVRGVVVSACRANPQSAILRCGAASGSTLVLNLGYHWTWLAFSQGHLLPHVRAGWRNGWLVQNSAPVVVISVLDVATLAALFLTVPGYLLLVALYPR